MDAAFLSSYRLLTSVVQQKYVSILITYSLTALGQPSSAPGIMRRGKDRVGTQALSIHTINFKQFAIIFLRFGLPQLSHFSRRCAYDISYQIFSVPLLSWKAPNFPFLCQVSHDQVSRDQSQS
jgi:hypothetical protein